MHKNADSSMLNLEKKTLEKVVIALLCNWRLPAILDVTGNEFSQLRGLRRPIIKQRVKFQQSGPMHAAVTIDDSTNFHCSVFRTLRVCIADFSEMGSERLTWIWGGVTSRIVAVSTALHFQICCCYSKPQRLNVDSGRKWKPNFALFYRCKN